MKRAVKLFRLHSVKREQEHHHCDKKLVCRLRNPNKLFVMLTLRAS